MKAKKNILNQKNKEKLNFLTNHIQKIDNQEPELALLTKKQKEAVVEDSMSVQSKKN